MGTSSVANSVSAGVVVLQEQRRRVSSSCSDNPNPYLHDHLFILGFIPLLSSVLCQNI